jgi:hypothetical protein
VPRVGHGPHVRSAEQAHGEAQVRDGAGEIGEIALKSAQRFRLIAAPNVGRVNELTVRSVRVIALTSASNGSVAVSVEEPAAPARERHGHQSFR